MNRSRLLRALPYAITLAGAALFFELAGDISYSARPGHIGPHFWPRVALGLTGVVCLFEIAGTLLGVRGEAHGIADAIETAKPEAAARRRPFLLLGGCALTLAYGAFISILGFPLATFLFLVTFMYAGTYRSHAVIWLSSAIGTFALATLFLNVVYVSLPRGVSPFDRLTDLLVNLF